jgi:hypothetical protein
MDLAAFVLAKINPVAPSGVVTKSESEKSEEIVETIGETKFKTSVLLKQ